MACHAMVTEPARVAPLRNCVDEVSLAPSDGSNAVTGGGVAPHSVHVGKPCPQNCECWAQNFNLLNQEIMVLLLDGIRHLILLFLLFRPLSVRGLVCFSSCYIQVGLR